MSQARTLEWSWSGRRAWALVIPALVVLCGVTDAVAQGFAGGVGRGPSQVDPKDALAEAWKRGDYEQARKLAGRRDDAPALLVRARLANFGGELALGLRYTSAAYERATDLGVRERALAERAGFQWALGDWDEAVGALREYLAQQPKAHEVRVALGGLLMRRGEGAQARAVLSAMERAFNNGQLRTARDHVLLARAMVLLESYSDANFAYEQAFAIDPTDVAALVEWGELFLSKYNISDAARCFEDALEINPNHPEALLGMAQVEMQRSNYFEEARAFLTRAEQHAPAHPEVVTARAELAIYDGDCTRAVELADQVLRARPRHLDSFVIRAACSYLEDDNEAFNRRVAQALDLKGDFSSLYTRIARHALLVHRYTEAVDLYEMALNLRPDDGEALLGLGIGLTRVGREAEGVDFLERAFKADPYNIRAFNMVELYDETMPDYVFRAYEGFRLRAHGREAGPLQAMLPEWIALAMETFEEKYEFAAHDPVDVEVYPNPATFGVRAVGLPHISPHGVCFGRVVISRSPSEGNFNWKQVIWHELAHVYHIQKAGYRVPRWFTEGLAEYETNIKDASWVRHHDREIVASLRGDRIPSVVELDKRFTRARSYQGVLQAYHLSSLVIHFIMENHDFGAINAMLVRFSKVRDTGQVIQDVLGMSVAEFDAAFRAWLKRRYRGLRGQLIDEAEDVRAVSEIEGELEGNPDDARLYAELAMAASVAGDVERARSALKRALSLDAESSEVRYVAAFVSLRQGRARDAYEHGNRVLDLGADGYGVRVLLGHVSMQLEKPLDAQVHLIAATQLWPNGRDAWQRLRQLAQSRDDSDLERRATRRLFELDQNNPLIAKQWADILMDAGEFAGALEAIERWMAIDPFQPEVHRSAIRAALQVSDADRAASAYIHLGALLPDERPELMLDAVRAFQRIEHPAWVERFAELARDAGVTDQVLDRALEAQN